MRSIRSFRLFPYLRERFLGNQLEFRVRLFNVLAMAGALISVTSAAVSVLIGEPLPMALIYLGFCGLSAALLWYSAKSGRYQRCYLITIAAVFFVGFPFFFLMTGGYYGTMPYFFIFAVVFTIFMLDGKKALGVAALELALYAAVCLYAYAHDNNPNGRAILLDTVSSYSMVSISLGVCMYLHFRIYNRQQRDLEAAREEALRLSNVKNVFLANMSHEIRTPINVMLGMTDMILRESRNGVVSDYARKIRNAGNMLLVLVSNVLDFSKIESGNLETQESCYRTANLVQELYEIGAENVRKHALAFHIQVNPDLPSELFGGMPRIKQIVTNFISNAVKYTKAGSISLAFSHKTDQEGNRIILCISVEDTGAGIKQESLPMIFEAFTRLGLPEHQGVEGTGLGLAIARQLAEGMGGQIFVRSEFGSGSTFWVEVPQRVIDAKPIGDLAIHEGEDPDEPEESFTAPDARILVVDDNRENLETIQALLRRTLMRVDLVDSGTACLAAARQTDYHIILMDYMMPDMDGIETLRRLREIPGFGAQVIALTANAIAGTREKLLAEGFCAYVTKPVRARELEALLAGKLVQTTALVTRRTIQPQLWVAPELKAVLGRDLAVCGVSLERGLVNASDDLLLLARMAQAFARNHAASLAEMQAASDPVLLRRLAHSLKSAAGYVGADDLSSHARMTEQACASGDDTKIMLILPLLYLEWERVQRGLSAFAAHVNAVAPGRQQKRRGGEKSNG